MAFYDTHDALFNATVDKARVAVLRPKKENERYGYKSGVAVYVPRDPGYEDPHLLDAPTCRALAHLLIAAADALDASGRTT